ncbi:MAG: glycosyltransferase family 2 protein [Solirubrobacteraceae bacterium]
MITVIIPARDGGAHLARCLESIVHQDVDHEVEIVVVDSGSVDGSDALARSFGARVDRIEPATFNHGAARNVGISHARGEIIVFISQDAYAVDLTWLRRLTAPLNDDSMLAGVYGRQVAHDAANPSEVYFLDFLYGPNSRRQHAESVEQLSMSTTIFSNVNSAMRRETLSQFPFVEDIIMSEDQEWSCRVLLAGMSIQYEAGAVVRHSHSYTLRQAFRRFFDSGVSAERSYLAGAAPAAGVLRREMRRYAKGELSWLWRTRRRRWIPYAAVYEMAKFSGLQLGKRHRVLPVRFKRRMTALPNYWEQLPGYPKGVPGAPIGSSAPGESDERGSGETPWLEP